jgi:hypothetical protein
LLRVDECLELVDFAFAQVGRGIGAVELLRQLADDNRTGRIRQPGELFEMLVDLMAVRRSLEWRADEERAFDRRGQRNQ